MQKCKMAETGTVFVCEVTCAPEPIAVTATDQQFLGLALTHTTFVLRGFIPPSISVALL